MGDIGSTGKLVRMPGAVPSAYRTVVFALIAAAVSIWRFYECGLLPTETGDIVRHILYGVAVSHWGQCG